MYVVCEMRDLPNDVVLSAGTLYTSVVQGDIITSQFACQASRRRTMFMDDHDLRIVPRRPMKGWETGSRNSG